MSGHHNDLARLSRARSRQGAIESRLPLGMEDRR